jgi:hypothetical protein
MDKQFVTTSESPIVILEVRGNLRLKGTDELEVAVKSSDPNAVTIEQDGDTVTIRARSNLDINVPREAQVQVNEVRGETVLKGFQGELRVKEIHGNLTLRSIGPAMLDHVQGNLEVKNVEGSLEIQRVDGNATLRDVQGDLYVKTVHGNLQVYDVDGSVEANADGNISMNLDPTLSDHYSLSARGNIVCNVPEDASLELDIPKAGGRISINIPGVENGKNVKAPYKLTIGEGDAEMSLSAGGNIVLSGQMPELEMPDFEMEFESTFEGMGEAIGQQIEAQIEAQMQMLEEQLNTQIANMTMNLGASGLTPEQVERINQRAREASQRASERAEEKMRQAQERLERRMAATQQRMEQKARVAEARARRHDHHDRHGMGVGWPIPAIEPSGPAHEPVSDEERLTVLRLLEQKKISLEEAEALLTALEGKEG